MKILKSKRFTRTCASIFVGTMLFATVAQAATITKKIDATFRSIKVYFNNQQKPMAQEPFIYNGSVYLPVRAVSEVFDKNIQWDSANNSVYITDKGISSSTTVQQLQQEVASKNFEIAKLNAEKTVLENKIKELEKNQGDVATGDLKKTKELLEDYFDYEHSIEWDFNLSQTSSRINVEVSFDSRTYGTKWDRLSKSTRDSFFRDICREIRIDHKDIAINGKVIDDRTDKTVGTFSYSKSNSFSYTDESSYSFSALEKDLLKTYSEVNSVIAIESIKLTGDEDDITFTVVVDLYKGAHLDEWNDLRDVSSSKNVIRKLLRDIAEEIDHTYDGPYIQGFIEDSYNSYNKLADYDNGTISIYKATSR